MVNAPPAPSPQPARPARASGSAWAGSLRDVADAWGPAGRRAGLAVLAAAGVTAAALAFWPLGGGPVGAAGGPDPRATLAGHRTPDESWRSRTLRGPLVDAPPPPPTETFYEPPVYDDPPPPASLQLVGVAYRRHGSSFGFFRDDFGVVQLLGVGDVWEGLTVRGLTATSAELERDGRTLILPLEAADGGAGAGVYEGIPADPDFDADGYGGQGGEPDAYDVDPGYDTDPGYGSDYGDSVSRLFNGGGGAAS